MMLQARAAAAARMSGERGHRAPARLTVPRLTVPRLTVEGTGNA